MVVKCGIYFMLSSSDQALFWDKILKLSISSVSQLSVVIGSLVQLSPWPVPFTYLGEKLEKYSFSHSVSWPSKPVGVHLSPMSINWKVHLGYGQVTIDFIRVNGHWLQSKKPSIQQCYVITTPAADLSIDLIVLDGHWLYKKVNLPFRVN